MRFPHKARSLEAVQKNFDFLGSRIVDKFGVERVAFSGIRTTGFVATPVGFSVVPLLTTDIPKGSALKGFIVVMADPTVHFNFFWVANVALLGLGVTNQGVVQNVNFNYVTVSA